MSTISLRQRLRSALQDDWKIRHAVEGDRHVQVISHHGKTAAVILPIDADMAAAVLTKSDEIVSSLEAADADLRAGRTVSLDSMLGPSWLVRRLPGQRLQELASSSSGIVNVEIEDVDESTSRLVLTGPKDRISVLERQVQRTDPD